MSDTRSQSPQKTILFFLLSRWCYILCFIWYSSVLSNHLTCAYLCSEYMTYVLEALELEDVIKNYERRDATGWCAYTLAFLSFFCSCIMLSVFLSVRCFKIILSTWILSTKIRKKKWRKKKRKLSTRILAIFLLLLILLLYLWMRYWYIRALHIFFNATFIVWWCCSIFQWHVP